MAENFPMPVKDITDSINPMDLKQDQLKKKKKNYQDISQTNYRKPSREITFQATVRRFKPTSTNN